MSLFKSQPAKAHRLDQLASLLQHELGRLLPKIVEVPLGVLVSVGTIRVSEDLKNATRKIQIKNITPNLC